jgi:hypothetical protein
MQFMLCWELTTSKRKIIWNATEAINTGQIARILPVPIEVTTETTAGSKHFLRE